LKKLITVLLAAVLFAVIPMSEDSSAMAEEEDSFHFATFDEAVNEAMKTADEGTAPGHQRDHDRRPHL
jgi:hypothetical protein